MITAKDQEHHPRFRPRSGPRCEIAWNTSLPRPGRKKTFSMMIAPASRNEN